MPELTHALPLEAAAQQRVALQWHATHVHGGVAPGVRPQVGASWSRALRMGVSPQLAAAPMVLEAEDIVQAHGSSEWLRVALGAIAAQRGAYAAGGSVVTLFDAAGRMLHAEGEARALDGLAEINFRPGALWSEHAVGTNGPGTALAVGEPVHVVGAEHFCERWHGWHCAAVPLRDPLTHTIIGALDLSGYRDTAHPHTLLLVMALAAAIEQMLKARALEHRSQLLARFAQLCARWPGDALIVVDRTGTVLGASPGAPAALHPLAPLPEPLRAELAAIVSASTSELPRSASLPCDVAMNVTVHPFVRGTSAVGACLHIEKRTAAAAAVRVRNGAKPPTRYTLDDLVGESPALRDAHRVAIAAAANALPVLLLGESGTGKEVFAQGIHAASDRSARPFIAVNCAALPASLVESELFGYVGGAFSGARREGGTGKFEAAHGGTILLDEVGDLPLPAQAALLRVLQEGEVTKVGATRGVPVDVRVIAATNRDITEALRTGAFREDLYYRLSVLTIALPSLRERRSDIDRLALRFLAEAQAELGRFGHSFATQTLDALRACDWPGNVRELRNVIWRVVALAQEPVITTAALPPELRAASVSKVAAVPVIAGADVADPAMPIEAWQEERERIARVVERARSMAEAADLLGVARSTLYRQMAKYGLAAGRVVRR